MKDRPLPFTSGCCPYFSILCLNKPFCHVETKTCSNNINFIRSIGSRKFPKQALNCLWAHSHSCILNSQQYFLSMINVVEHYLYATFEGVLDGIVYKVCKNLFNLSYISIYGTFLFLCFVFK